ncbi:MAG: hypothetical protein QOH61_791 [Chloroflexota bacterium]|nr:hypothetical protein [Chloroflexota bacterium]
MALSSGREVWPLASTSWAVAFDHAYTWLALVTRAELQPSWTHYTLARAILEGSATTLWLLDDALTSVERRDRAVNFQLLDLQHRATYEKAPGAVVPALGPKGKPGDKRRDDLRAEMKRLGILVETPTGPTRRCEETLRLGWLYQLLSAYAHGQQWSSVRGTPEGIGAIPNRRGIYAVAVSADDQMTRRAVTESVGALETALARLEKYTGYR